MLGVLSLALLGLLALVAVASSGHRPFGGSERTAQEPSTVFWDYLFSVAIAVWFVLAGLLIWALALGRAARRQQKRPRSMVGLFLLAGFFLGLAIAARTIPGERGVVGSPRGGGSPGTVQTTIATARVREYTPEFRWAPVILLGSVGVVTAAYFTARGRYRRRVDAETSDETLLEELAGLVDETLEDLRAERDPRRAVIASYARMERALAAYGLPRRGFEAPLEYLDRIAGALHDPLPSARRLVFELTHLYERAKFSQHAIDVEMKDEAIATLSALRDELRAAGAA
jgi:hypothetical protein